MASRGFIRISYNDGDPSEPVAPVASPSSRPTPTLFPLSSSDRIHATHSAVDIHASSMEGPSSSSPRFALRFAFDLPPWYPVLEAFPRRRNRPETNRLSAKSSFDKANRSMWGGYWSAPMLARCISRACFQVASSTSSRIFVFVFVFFLVSCWNAGARPVLLDSRAAPSASSGGTTEPTSGGADSETGFVFFAAFEAARSFSSFHRSANPPRVSVLDSSSSRYRRRPIRERSNSSPFVLPLAVFGSTPAPPPSPTPLPDAPASAPPFESAPATVILGKTSTGR
mmetsp:Transcript_16317/g.37756  ORF Transcript_16317/g.37756 Transcript_16317/m.37756 type:complete len:283 (+) Transcript_16317:339-1187(+)